MLTYLDVLSNLVEVGDSGLPYASLSKAGRVHLRSLNSEGYVQATVFDGEAWQYATLDTEGVVVELTPDGYAYASLLQEAGLISGDDEEPQPEPKPKRSSTRKQTTRRAKPSTQSDVSSVLDGVSTPKGSNRTKRTKTRTTTPKGSADRVTITLTSAEAEAMRRVLALREVQALAIGPVGASA